MKDEGALKPTLSIKSFIERPRDEELDQPTKDEEIFAVGADKSFWLTLKKHFENQIRQLDEINEAAIAGGMPFDEIGRNALVISQVKGVLKKIVNVVEDAREARDGKIK